MTPDVVTNIVTLRGVTMTPTGYPSGYVCTSAGKRLCKNEATTILPIGFMTLRRPEAGYPLPMFKTGPPHSPCYIDRLPPEIISEILTIACHNAGNDIRLKWRFPSVVNSLSRRFYHITMHTNALWIYIYLYNPPYHFDHIRTRIARPHSLPFAADVYCFAQESTRGVGDTDDEGENWREVIKTITPIVSRLSTLIFYSVSSNAPILALLDHDMPMLKTLDIEGMTDGDSELPEYHLSPTQLPALRTLRSSGVFHWQDRENLPETVEELYLDLDRWVGRGEPSEGFWEFLPVNLRVLEMENLPWNGIAPPHDGKLQLPNLMELSLLDCPGPEELSLIEYMDGSRLNKLSICALTALRSRVDQLPFVLKFPSLTHFTWRSQTELSSTAEFLRQCPALVSVHIDTVRLIDSKSELVESLAREPTLLPRLEDLKVYGPSIFSLRKMVQARPHFKRLEVHASELGLRPQSTKEEFEEWEECVGWLEGHVELVGNCERSPTFSLRDRKYHKDNQPRYRSWEDMMAGRAIDIEC